MNHQMQTAPARAEGADAGVNAKQKPFLPRQTLKSFCYEESLISAPENLPFPARIFAYNGRPALFLPVCTAALTVIHLQQANQVFNRYIMLKNERGRKMNCYQIMAVRITDRGKSAVDVQKILTEYGCSVMTRLGLHDQSVPGTCSPAGLLVLQLCSDAETSKELERKLNALDGVKAQLVDLSD